jgi:hypothetical protein
VRAEACRLICNLRYGREEPDEVDGDLKPFYVKKKKNFTSTLQRNVTLWTKQFGQEALVF